MAFWKRGKNKVQPPSQPPTRADIMGRSQTLGDIGAYGGYQQPTSMKRPPQFVPDMQEVKIRARSISPRIDHLENKQTNFSVNSNNSGTNILGAPGAKAPDRGNKLAQIEAQRKAKLEQASQGQQVDFRALLKKKPRSESAAVPPPAPADASPRGQAASVWTHAPNGNDASAEQSNQSNASNANGPGATDTNTNNSNAPGASGASDFVPQPYIPPAEEYVDQAAVVAPGAAQTVETTQAAQAVAAGAGEEDAKASESKDESGTSERRRSSKMSKKTPQVVAAYNQVMAEWAAYRTEINAQVEKLSKKMESLQQSKDWNVKTKLKSEVTAGAINDAGRDLMTLMQKELASLEDLDRKLDTLVEASAHARSNSNANKMQQQQQQEASRKDQLKQKMKQEESEQAKQAVQHDDMRKLQRAMSMPIDEDVVYNGCVFYALKEYKGRNDTEWSLTPGERLVCTLHQGDWYYGYKEGNPYDLKYFYKTLVARVPLMQQDQQDVKK